MKRLNFILIGLIFATALTAQDQTVNGNLYVANTNNRGIRIGKVGDAGNLNVAYGALAAQHNLDFTGYRDVNNNQIGARIAAIRFNKHIANSAFVQKTGLAFYTNPLGLNDGIIDIVERMRITPEGNIGIGTSNPTALLSVNGTIRSKEVKIEATGWSDFVFGEDYKLPALSEVESHIKEHKHLPDVPSEKQVIEEGVNVVEMQAKLLQKIEELTLYVIEQDKKILKQDKKIKQLEEKLNGE